MSADRPFYPNILSSDDVKILHETVRDLVDAGHNCQLQRNPERVARIVLRLYRIGLTERSKLFHLAGLMADQDVVKIAAEDGVVRNH
ncbi:MAG: hypothetical protein ACK4QP_15475 [Pseudorhizobium sp.]